MWYLTFVLLLSIVCGTFGFSITVGIDGDVHFEPSVSAVASKPLTLYAVNGDGSVKWTFESGYTDIKTSMSKHTESSDGTIYVVGTEDATDEAHLYSLDGTDGSVHWHLKFGNLSHGDLPELAIGDSAVYMVYRTASGQTMLKAVDLAGALGWEKSLDESWYVRVTEDGDLLAENGDQTRLIALQKDNGSVKWTFETEQHQTLMGMGSGWASSKEGIFVAPRGNGTLDLLFLSGGDGSVLWKVSSDPYDPYNHSLPRRLAPIVGCNGEVYMAMVDKDGACKIRAFDINGNTLPRTLPCLDFQHSTMQSETGSEEDIFIHSNFVGNPSIIPHDTNIVAYSGTTSSVLWNASFVGNLNPSFGANGTVLGAQYNPRGQPHGGVVVIRNGEEAWRTDVGDGFLMAMDGTTYVVEKGRYGPGCEDWCLDMIHAFDINGVQRWNVTPARHILV